MFKLPSVRFLAAVLTACAVPLTGFAEVVDVVTVTTKDNAQVHFIAGTHPHVTFTDDGVSFKFTNIDNQENWPEFTYPLDNFASITYSKQDRSLTAVGRVERSEVLFEVTDSFVRAEGLPEGTALSVYSVAGVRLGVCRAGADATAELDISGFAPGAYVVSTPAAIYKFVKR